MAKRRFGGVLDATILALVCFMVLASPLTMGSVAPWAASALLAIASVCLGLWLARGALTGRFTLPRHVGCLLLLAFAALAYMQTVPLPADTLRAVSPGAHTLYSETLPPYPQSAAPRTVSIAPYSTRLALRRFLVAGIVFCLAASVPRKRWMILCVGLAVVAAGAFQALYGCGEHFSGNRHIFWFENPYSVGAVFGTYINRNHLAGLLAMALPVSIGLLVGLAPRRHGRTRPSRIGAPVGARIAEAVSSKDFNLRMLLGLVAATMAIALFFTMSRAGIAAAGLAVLGFALLLSASSGRARSLLVMAVVIGVAGLFAANQAQDWMWERLGEPLQGESLSMAARLDLWRGGVEMWRDYPLFGSGLGSTGQVYYRYQSARFGDRWADYLHNDWLQLLSETGVVGATVLIAGLLWLFASAAKDLRKQEDLTCKWLGAGCLLGVAAMGFHSVFDFNLGKITSNALIFAALLGLAYRCGKHTPRGTRPSDLPQPLSMFGRVAFGILAPLVVAAAALQAPPVALADMEFNAYRASPNIRGRTENYFFLPIEARDDLALVSAYHRQPDNPAYAYALGIEALRKADDMVKDVARANARRILGAEVAAENPEALERLAAIYQGSLTFSMKARRRPMIRDAAFWFRQAILLCPSNPNYHIRLAAALQELGASDAEVQKQVETALSLAPNMPRIAYRAGRVSLAMAVEERDAAARLCRLAEAEDRFRAAIAADPNYTRFVYPLANSVLGGRDALVRVTPSTIRAMERLYDELRATDDWEGMRLALETLYELAEKREASDGADTWREEPPPQAALDETADFDDVDGGGTALSRGYLGFDMRSPAAIKMTVAARQSQVYAMLGQWERRQEAVRRYRENLRVVHRSELEEIQRLRSLHRNTEAMVRAVRTLEKDWDNPDLLLEAAEISAIPHAAEATPHHSDPLDHLTRLATSGEILDETQHARALDILSGLRLARPLDQTRAEFIRAALYLNTGRAEEGVLALERLKRNAPETLQAWRQGHLVHYWLGKGLERLGRTEPAAESYRAAVKLAPAHEPSLCALATMPSGTTPLPADLAALQEEARANIRQLTPQVEIGADFGGKLTLLGYTREADNIAVLNAAGADQKREERLVFHWRAEGSLPVGTRPRVSLRRRDGSALLDTMPPPTAIGGAPYRLDNSRKGERFFSEVAIPSDSSALRSIWVGVMGRKHGSRGEHFWVKTDVQGIWLRTNTISFGK